MPNGSDEASFCEDELTFVLFEALTNFNYNSLKELKAGCCSGEDVLAVKFCSTVFLNCVCSLAFCDSDLQFVTMSGAIEQNAWQVNVTNNSMVYFSNQAPSHSASEICSKHGPVFIHVYM